VSVSIRIHSLDDTLVLVAAGFKKMGRGKKGGTLSEINTTCQRANTTEA